MRESSGAGQVEGLGWADCAGPVQGKLQGQMNKEKRWKTTKEVGILLPLGLPSCYTEYPCKTSWPSIIAQLDIVGQTHQTSAISIGEGYIQSELCYDRANEFLKACIARLSKSPIYIPPGRFLLWHQINLQFKCPVDFKAFLRVYLYFSQTSSDIRYPFALEP